MEGEFKMRIMLSLFMLLTLSACAGHGFEGMEKPEKDGAIVYYYRPWRFTGAALPLDVRENNDLVVSLGTKEYKAHKTSTGKKTASVEGVGVSDYVPFTAEKGKSYFIRVERTFFGGIMGGVEMDMVPEEKALREIQECSKTQ